MKYFVITLERTLERYSSFCKSNPNVPHEKFSGIDGRALERAKFVRDGLITEAVSDRYSNGTLGGALSHIELWKKCAAGNEPYTVFEDDAVLCRNFRDIVESSTYDDGWDFIFWGSNLDRAVGVHLVPNVVYGEFKVHEDLFLNGISSYPFREIQPRLYRCSFAVGLVCYSVSPKGARHLLSNAFPIRDYDKPYLNFGLDHVVLEELDKCIAWYCLPPIAVTPNDRATSTTQND